METKKKENRISILGEFADRNFEKEFIDNYLGRTKRYFRPIILALGILYMLFIIPDYFVIKNHEILKVVLANRAIFLLSIIVLFIASKKVKNYTKLAYWITIYEIFAAISFLVILGQYDSANYLIQSFPPECQSRHHSPQYKLYAHFEQASEKPLQIQIFLWE